MNVEAAAPEAVLIWNSELGGASVLMPVDALSPAGREAFEGFGFDGEAGTDGLGYLTLSDGGRLLLTAIDPDAAREAAECGVAVVVEVERLGRDGDHQTREYTVDVLSTAPAPGM